MHRLLINYLENTCNPHELEQVLAYLKTDQGQQHLAEMIDQDIQKAEPIGKNGPSDADYNQLFERIHARLQEKQKPTSTSVPFYKRWYAVAAATTGLLLLAAAGWFLTLAPKMTTHQTTYGETTLITLPDGSVVTLNARSSLMIPDDFTEWREVWLEGEAFFEVKEVKSSDEEAYVNFVVHTGGLQVEVLGTSFNVQNREGKTRVVLKSGKVKLTSADEEVTMEPGELAEVSENGHAIQKKVVNPEVYSAWTENKLLCNDTPLSEIATVIEHRYGKKVIFQDATLKEMTVTGTMPLHSLPLLMEVLKESLTIHIQAYEETLIISKPKE